MDGGRAGATASCGAVRRSGELVGPASRLGRDVTVDAAALTPMVLERVRAAKVEARRSRWVRQAVAVGSLAAAAVLLVLLMPDEAGPVATATEVATEMPGELQLAELDDAGPGELEMVMTEFEEPGSPASSLDGPELEGLGMSQVRALCAHGGKLTVTQQTSLLGLLMLVGSAAPYWREDSARGAADGTRKCGSGSRNVHGAVKTDLGLTDEQTAKLRGGGWSGRKRRAMEGEERDLRRHSRGAPGRVLWATPTA